MKFKPLHLPRLLILMLYLTLLHSPVHAQNDARIVIENGSLVSLQLAILLQDGTEYSNNAGKEPLVYRHNNNEMPPALEQHLLGLAVNESRQILLQPEDLYGPVRPEAFVEMELERIPQGSREVGAVIMIEGPGGIPRLIRVHDMRDDKVVIDFNHPLAGKTVTFDIKVLAID
jgi:FKBP-type peptidyl-prolyl cis-trans isomerase 2